MVVRRKHQLYHQTKVQLVRQYHHPRPWKQETQTGLSEEEEEAHYKKANDDAITKLWENIYLPDQEVDWEVLIGKLLVHFARENRSKRPEKPDFLNLDKLEALRDRAFEGLRP